MVTATNGTVILRGKSGNSYPINVYISDVVGAICPLSLYGLAGTTSDTFYQLEEDCRIEDIAITTGPTVSKALNLQLGNRPGYGVFPFATYLDTLNNRPRNVSGMIRAGSKFQLIQSA